MEVSTQLKKKAKALGTSWQNFVMADLMALGYSKGDAYIIAYSENIALSYKQNEGIRKQVQDTDKFAKLVMERTQALASIRVSTYDDQNRLELIGAEETAREILTVAMGMPEKSKERGEMFMKYADLIRKNDTATKDDEEPVRIYLPMKCTICPFKKKFDKEKSQSRDD